MHDLEVLLNEALTHEASFEQFREACQRITQFYVADRYPFVSCDGLNEDDVRDSLQQVAGLIERIERELAGSQQQEEIQFHTNPNLASVASALKHLTDLRNNEWCCIFSVGQFYIQFLFHRRSHIPDHPHHPPLHGEAVSNELLPEEIALTEAQITKLVSMGWRRPGRFRSNDIHNFFRFWEESDEEVLLQIARDVLRALVEVYGVSPSEQVEVEFVD